MKKQTKHEKIIALYKEGVKPKDIAVKLKIDVMNVYKAKYLENKKTGKTGTLPAHILEILKTDTGGSITFIPVVKKSFFQKIKDFIGV